MRNIYIDIKIVRTVSKLYIGYTLEYNMKQECSLCGFVVDTEDTLVDIRKKRHVEGRHTRHETESERDGSIIQGSGMGNIIIGKVSWVRAWN